MQAPRPSGRAGDSAARRYGVLYRAWRRRVWPVLAVIAVFGVVSGTIGLLVGGGWAWGFGFASGGFVGMLLWILASPPARIQNWRWGSEGEKRTAKRLQRLDRGHWQVWHDLVRTDDTNIDHVVAGAAGVFVLDSKEWTGLLSVSGQKVSVQWWEDAARFQQYDVQWSLRRAAREVHDLLLKRAYIDTYVQPVVVLWGDFAERQHQENDVWYVHGDDLVSWLEARPARPVFLPRVVACVDELSARGLP